VECGLEALTADIFNSNLDFSWNNCDTIYNYQTSRAKSDRRDW